MKAIPLTGLMSLEKFERVTADRLAHALRTPRELAALIVLEHADLVRAHWLVGATMTGAVDAIVDARSAAQQVAA